MTTQRLIGIVLLAAGAIFLIMGMNASNSIADQVSTTFTGRFTEHTTLFIVGGAVACVAGVVMLISGARGTRA